MGNTQVEFDHHLRSAGECFMFLLWVESYMRDLVVLQEGGEDMRNRYNEAFGRKNHPSDFAQNRLKLSDLTFGKIKNRFLCHWPQWKEDKNVHEAIERIVIFRNGFGHAHVQPFRDYLLYTPNKNTWKSINEYTKCHKCLNYHKDCQCSQEDIADPRTLIFHCLDREFLINLYGDIRTIDLKCFVNTAKSLNIAYQGIAWPEESGYEIGQNHPLGRDGDSVIPQTLSNES